MASTSGTTLHLSPVSCTRSSLTHSLPRRTSCLAPQCTPQRHTRRVVRRQARVRSESESSTPVTALEANSKSTAGAREGSSKTDTASCCCLTETDSAELLTAASPASASAIAGEEAQGSGQQTALLVGAVVAAPLVIAALNPSLLPFDSPLDLDAVADWLDEAVYFASHEINRTVNSQLAGEGVTPGILSLVFGAGLLTSFAPCTLSVLPLTIGYIAGFNPDGTEDNEKKTSVVLNACFFALGLATTFSGLGITAALAGKAYGSTGPGLPIAVSAITMCMGLNLLGLFNFQMPSLFANFDAKEAAAALPVEVQMYLGGMTFALLASPCSTPVLASLLGYVASSEDVLVGFALLLAYTFGRVMPVLVAASFTGSMKQMLSLRQYSKYINPASGALLLGIGTFSFLNRVFPEATAMAVGLGSHARHM